MAFASGTRLGVYEITSLIGVGGMGEVYRASDMKLGREVAIKTLPSELANDRDRLARFEREAKLLASLSHPHIAAIYGLHEHEGTQFVAMELIDGETLERKLSAHPLPVEDALRLGLQIAEALEAAHEKGVVHRDLKPANIMLTGGGQIKVLDFGLAKALSSDPNKTALGHSPVASLAMTQAGLLLGTAGYMSPEQASGQSIDQRADIWAFGVVLYEMLAGVPLFSGESVPHVLAGVLRSDPDWSRLPENLHPRLELLLERCLAKKPRNRLHAMADARVEIEAILADPKGVTRERAVAAAHGRANALPALAAIAVGALVLGAIAGWFLRPMPGSAPRAVVRFSLPLPAETTFSAGPANGIAISPDGSRIAYAADRQIFVHELRERAAHPVPGTFTPAALTAVAPTFSPDGQWLAYVEVTATGGPFLLKRVRITGGAPVTIHEGQGAFEFHQGLTWPTADTILFANVEEGIVRIPSNGGTVERLVAPTDGEILLSPQLLSDGKAVLFTSALRAEGGLPAARVVMQSIGGTDRKTLWDGGSAPRYLHSGHLIFAQGPALFAIPFDPETRSVRGGAVQMIEPLRRSTSPANDAANFAVADNGTLVILPPDPALVDGGGVEATLTWVDRGGRESPLPVRPDDYTLARISPDGSKIALVVGSGLSRPTRPAIWIFDQRTENLSLLTADPAGDDSPLWSFDGRKIFFRSFRRDDVGVYAIDLESGETTTVGVSADYPFAIPWTLSADDKFLGVIHGTTVNNFNIATISVADGVFARLLDEPVSESEPSISPNGAWMAYAVGRVSPQIDIRPFPAVSRTRIPIGPGQSPVFSRDGSELFYFDGNGLSAIPISYEPALRVGSPRRLFESAGYLWSVDGRAWDVDPSGQRFLLISQRADSTNDGREGQRIDVVLNWFEELSSRAPVQ